MTRAAFDGGLRAAGPVAATGVETAFGAVIRLPGLPGLRCLLVADSIDPPTRHEACT